MANIKQTVKLGVFTLAIMNVTAVVSLRGLPAEAVYGMSSAFYYLFAAIVFLIPTSLVAAELAAMFQDKQGGVFRWVGEAYGKKLGFLAIWVQWIESTIWYPTVLTFGAVSIAFIGMNDVHDMSLANNKYYTLVVVLVIYWLATFISLKGMSWVGKVAKVGGLVGTIIPAGLLIVLGIIYLATGGHSVQELSEGCVYRRTDYGAYLRVGHIRSGCHYSGQGHQPYTKPAGRFRQLLPLHPCFLAVAGYSRCTGVRRAGRCADMGCRSVQRYICRR